MKKAFFFFLLLAGSVKLFAQEDISRGIKYEKTSTSADFRFNQIKPGNLKVNFKFYNLNNGGMFMLEMASIKQLYHLPNLDSMFDIMKVNLKLLADSLKDDGITRRVDYLGWKTPEVRITQYDNRPKVFAIKNGEPYELKTERDTIRFGSYCESWGEIFDLDKKTLKPFQDPFFLTLIVNNVSDIYNLPDSVFSICLNRLKQDVSADFVAQSLKTVTYTSQYNMKTDRLDFPIKLISKKDNENRNRFDAGIYASLQYPRGSFVPSASVGLRFIQKRDSENYFHLMIDWYFFFSRDSLNRLKTDANNFLTFHFYQFEEGRNKTPFSFIGNFSLGYLINRRGEWFEKSTFKWGFPAVRSGSLQLEPECYFNNFFKNFSPTIKLTIHFD